MRVDVLMTSLPGPLCIVDPAIPRYVTASCTERLHVLAADCTFQSMHRSRETARTAELRERIRSRAQPHRSPEDVARETAGKKASDSLDETNNIVAEDHV